MGSNKKVVKKPANRKKKSTLWSRAGTIGVDAGLVMIVDPCYVLHRKPTGEVVNPAHGHHDGLDPCFGEDWGGFCDKLQEDGEDRVVGGIEMPAMPVQRDVTQIQSKQGDSWCSAVVAGCFGGDGLYPVYVRRGPDGFVESLKVVFRPRTTEGEEGEA